MSIDVADQGLLSTVLELAHDPDLAATGDAIAESLGIPAHYSQFIQRRLQHNRELGLLDRDSHGNWHLTATGLAAATADAILTPPAGATPGDAPRRPDAA